MSNHCKNERNVTRFRTIYGRFDGVCGIIGGMGNEKKRGNMGVYSSLVNQKKKIAETAKMIKKGKGKKQSEPSNLAPLPKEQPARFFAHFRWERIKAYWFSKAGLKRIGKIRAACVLLGIIGVGALFVYYKSQLKEIELNDLAISETVNTYLDRNGEVLWEDKGDADYRLVVDGDQISPYVRQATVAIEDKNFYSHPGVDLWGLVRATISTVTGQGVQGGSTLTQQLIKQVYFANEAASANRGGISRKIKELILSIELEKMYSKEQIITMYLNESPYGGRRNGIESAAQTYFGKSAKDLTLAESAMLAAIPNNPAVLNPYNEYGHEALLARQQKTLDVMAEMGYITQEEADEAKEVPVLDQVLPESNQYKDIKAPHYVMEVKKILEAKYPEMKSKGGYTVKTALDWRAQQIAEEAVEAGNAMRYLNNSDNIAMASVDVETGQVIAMVGSSGWETPVYGEVNAATALIEPGSSIKPLIDYTPLLSLEEGTVYGPGTILVDENIDNIYCAGSTGSCSLRNFTGKFYGNVTIRQALSNSLNIGAVKALAIVGIDNALEILHGLGDVSYCDDHSAGLSMAIGSGCTVRLVEHANAFASIARGGSFKDLVYVLEMKDSKGKVVEAWHDTAAKRIIDEQVAYEISSILSDADSRASLVFGAEARSFGFVVPGVWTAAKTGTTTTANSSVAKDQWIASYSTALSTVVWNGNHDGSGLSASTSQIVRRVVNDFMERVHKEIYAEEGKWHPGDQPVRPAGIQELTIGGKTDIWPSWYTTDKSGIKKEKIKFNKETGLQAADCTSEDDIIEIEVTRTTDPVSGTETISVEEPYKYGEFDTCSVTSSTKVVQVTPSSAVGPNGLPESVTFTLSPDGDIDLVSYRILVDGKVAVPTSPVTIMEEITGITYSISGSETTITIEVTDSKNRVYKKTYTVQ